MTTTVTADYTLSAGQVLSATDEDGLHVFGDLWNSATVNGRIQVSAVANGFPVIGVRAGGDSVQGPIRTLTVGPEGAISVTSSIVGFASTIASGGTGSRVRVVNQGTLEVRTPGEAWGVGAGDGGFVNQGTLTVNATQSATGVSMGYGGAFLNSGAITVTAGSTATQGASGLRINATSNDMEVVNTGTIRVAATAAPAKSLGVQIAGYTTLRNSGLIEADMALALVRDGIISGNGRNSDITNTGTIRGEVFLNNTAGEPVKLTNAGRIEGVVTLNTGADTYNGVGGVVTGVVHGESGADSLLGGSGTETLQGEAGNDTVDGGEAGADILSGGEGSDVLSFAGASAAVVLDVAAATVSRGGQFSGFEQYVGSAYDDVMRGTAAADTLSAGGGADTVNGGAGDDRIDGGEGQSYLRGDEGADSLTGGAGFDDINGNMGNDTASGGLGEDWVVGGKDADLLYGDAAYDLVYGNLGNDTCEGGDGDDIVRGGQDSDVVRGGAGDDFVSGDRGDDTMTGGAGADVFHSFGDAGLDRVTDFNYAQGDRVRLDPGSEYSLAMVGFDTVVTLAGGARVVLVDISFPELPRDWIGVS